MFGTHQWDVTYRGQGSLLHLKYTTGRGAGQGDLLGGANLGYKDMNLLVMHIIEKLSQASDHPILLTFPESEYLKGLVCRVL